MKLIAACDRNWAIGRDNGLLFDIPLDMKHFRETTKGSVVVMGRKTLESFPNKKPLKNRVNIVLSRSMGWREDCLVVSDLNGLFEELTKLNGKNIFVIGGAEIYKLLLEYCDEAIITRVDTVAPLADRFFPDLDKNPDWEIVNESVPVEDNGYRISFCTYKNLKPQKLDI